MTWGYTWETWKRAFMRPIQQNNPVNVDAFAGIRYTKLQADLAGPSRTVGGSESWADLVVGALATFPVAQHVDLLACLDLGGGGSKFTILL
jgi:hypothetical protein